MNSSLIRVGIDLRGDRFFAARVESVDGQPRIKALFRFEDLASVGNDLLDSSRLIVSVPDSRVIVKRLTLESEQADLRQRVAFELCQVLMEEERNLLVDSIDTGRADQFLGLAIRKESFRRIAEKTLGRQLNGSGGVGGRMRGAALADGYLKFCKPIGGDLIGLVDFCAQEISVVFLYRGKVIDLSHLSATRFDLSTEERLYKAAIDLKALINFKMDTFFKSGISLPLAALIVTGDGVDKGSRELLKRQLAADIRPAEFNSGLLPEQYSSENLPLEKYLVPLGLAAN